VAPRPPTTAPPIIDTMASQLRVACVVTTIGRPVHLNRLLQSLAEQTHPPSQIIIVDQSTTTDTATVIDTWRDRLPLHRTTSTRGASHGRNTGLATLNHHDYDIVTFPDDDVRLAPDALANATTAFTTPTATTTTNTPTAPTTPNPTTDTATIGVVSGVPGVQADWAVRGATAARPTVLDERTVWSHTIEWSCFFRAEFLRMVGGFDETLGVGNPTPWQSGEGTDILLRGMQRGWTVLFDPSIVIHETGDQGEPADPACRAKARHYARGTGRVFRLHHGPYLWIRTVLRPIGGAVLCVLSGRTAEARWHWQRAVGRVEGLTGRLLGRTAAPEALERRRFRDAAESPGRVRDRATRE
jgi:glycosyl transferase family 2